MCLSCLSLGSGSASTVTVVRVAGWYEDPTGRHEWRYWQPGWGDLAADGTAEVHDPLRPRWRRYVGLALVGQLVLVPILGFVLVKDGDKQDARVGVEQAADQSSSGATAPSIVVAACPGERLRHIALSVSTGKGTIDELLWSATGDAAADHPVTLGQTPPGMQTKHRLQHPVGDHQKDLVLSVSTNQVAHPATLTFSMDDVPTSGTLSYHGMYGDEQAFRTAALGATPCGSSPSSTRHRLVAVLLVEVGLALVGLALLLLPYYAGPPAAYDEVTRTR